MATAQVCPLLEELTLSSNDLQALEGLQNLQKLRRESLEGIGWRFIHRIPHENRRKPSI